MSDIASFRTIPSRTFSSSFLSSQKVVKPVYTAWLPKFVYEGETLKVSFSVGTVNGFLPSNWNEEFTILKSSDRYAKLEVVASKAGIQSVTIKMESNPSITNPFNKEYPPAKFSFILGAFKGPAYSMVFSNNISVNPVEVFRLEKTSGASPGKDPYDRYFSWQIV